MIIYGTPHPVDWHELYRLALTETAPRNLPKRIADAHAAIMDRIKVTAATPRDWEQQMMDDALHGLRVLQEEFESRLQEYGDLRNVPRISPAEDSTAERIRRARYILHPGKQEPKGWRELCRQLQAEKDPDRFQELIGQINRLLSAHEKANREESA